MSRPARILVIDNNLADQEMVREMLPVHGINAEIVTATEGEEACDLLMKSPNPDARGTIEAVLLDLHLGRHHGREILARIRGCPDLAGIPVVVFTGAADVSERDQCLAAGADGFLIKPRGLAGFAEVAGLLSRLVGARRLAMGGRR